jgi:hypothetical protein
MTSNNVKGGSSPDDKKISRIKINGNGFSEKNDFRIYNTDYQVNL